MKKIAAVRKENLEKLIDDFIKGGGKSRAKFADKIAMSSGQLNQLVGNPTRNIGNNLARKIEYHLCLPDGFLDQNQDQTHDQQVIFTSHVEEFSSSQDENKIVEIPRLKSINNIMEVNMNPTGGDKDVPLQFNSRFLDERNILLENTAYAKVIGNSMIPVLPNNATVIINKKEKTILDGHMYLIMIGELLFVRLLYRLPYGRIRLKSYNSSEYPDEILNSDDIKIIGKIFWYSAFI